MPDFSCVIFFSAVRLFACSLLWRCTARCKQCGRALDINLKCKTHDYPVRSRPYSDMCPFNPNKTLLWINR